MFDPDFNARQEQAHWVELRGYVYLVALSFAFTLLLATSIIVLSNVP